MIISSQSETELKQPKKSKVLEDKSNDLESLRPKQILNYIGQNSIKKQLNIILESSRIRQKLPEHILFYGPPGLGKTTLASLISNELNLNFKTISAPSLQKQGDIVTLLLNLEPKTILFIDEIHRLKSLLEETLYTAMEDRQVDLVMGKGAGAQSTRLNLPEFTLIGATTMLGKISKPLKDRFASIFQMQPYTNLEIISLIEKNTVLLGLNLENSAKEYIASRSRGVPRVVNNILKRFLDFQVVHNLKILDLKTTQSFLLDLGILDFGLTMAEINYLKAVKENPLGLQTLANILNEEIETIEYNLEPYLMQLGFIDKTSRGRIVTLKGKNFLENAQIL
jgi:Holliday junction DNA helicase RuvB